MTGPADISFTRVEGKPYCDIQIVDNDILRDNSLISACYIMLQTDQRATLEELTKANYYPIYPYDLRGWWGDSIRDNPIGSKLWLNSRRKATDLVLTQHKRYAEEALQPLVDSGVAKEINVYAEWTSRGVMLMAIQVVRPDNSSTNETFTFIWEEVQNGV